MAGRAPPRPKAPRPGGPGARRPRNEASAPEIRLGFTPAGRETIAIIETELEVRGPSDDSSPHLTVGEAAAGRETLAAIAEELLRPAIRASPSAKVAPERARSAAPQVTAPEPRITVDYTTADATFADDERPTLEYGEEAPAPEAVAPESAAFARARAARDRFPAPAALPTTPRPMVVAPSPRASLQSDTALTPAQRRALVESRPTTRTPTLRPPGAAPPPQSGPGAAPRPGAASALSIHEMVTFVVRGADPDELAQEEGRRRFVLGRLASRLPVTGAEQIERIDVTPWTEKGTVVVRVWCRVT